MARALAQQACEQPVCSSSCYEVNLRGCLLQDLLVSFSRPPGSREEESFSCRLGEIQVCMWELGLWEEGVDGGGMDGALRSRCEGMSFMSSLGIQPGEPSVSY